MKNKLPLRTWIITVWVVPTTLEQVLGAQVRQETRTIEGYTLKDAKRRAGIED